jgi:fibronectin-binding autotransporter adhesin
MPTLPIIFDPVAGLFRQIRATAGSAWMLATLNAKTLFLNDATGALTNATAAAVGNQTVSRVISGAGDVVWPLSTTLTLSAANTYTGTTRVAAGTLSSTAHNLTSGASGLGAATNPIVVASGATLELAATGGRTTLMGNISGAGNINQNNSNSFGFLLGGDNSGFTGTYTRQVTCRNTNFTSNTAGSAAAAWVFNSDGDASFASVYLRYGAATDAWVVGMASGSNTLYFGSIASTDTNCQFGNFTQQVSQTANTTIEVGALGTNTTYAGKLVDTQSSSTAFTSSVLNVRKVGTGTWTLSGTNTYTGTTAINGGALYIAGSQGATATTVANTAGCRIGVGSAATKTATTSTLTMSGSNSAIDVHTNGTTVASRLNVTGAFAAGGCLVNVLGALNAGSYVIVSAGSSSGTLPVLGTNSSGRSVSFTLVAGVLTLIAV